MSGSLDFSTPKQAVEAMVDAGAVFTVRHRDDALGISFSYSMRDGGDIDRCRAILSLVKSKPAPFFEAFRAAVQDVANSASRGAA